MELKKWKEDKIYCFITKALQWKWICSTSYI